MLGVKVNEDVDPRARTVTAAFRRASDFLEATGRV